MLKSLLYDSKVNHGTTIRSETMNPSVICETHSKWLKSRTYRRIGVLAFLLLLATLIAPALSLAQTNYHQGPEAAPAEQAVPLPQVEVTLQNKTLQSVISSIGDRFVINSRTLIVGPDGKELGTANLAVPCEAKVTYSTHKRKKTARRIDVIRVGANATTRMTSEVPH
ncbi:hypothetical protein [Desulfatitalea alkaliphila]|uniref:Uncharacterized protein n=1 Tax=Desulfatitalea alkaliphila TaxID=2929485 RepID=A0AA41QZL8_9BACT|nr:hypothetical protein [Desulfatitalea alkaliphila]MCJ8499308.1 hypothetical protein [Desulfatitalea alkaliphila]